MIEAGEAAFEAPSPRAKASLLRWLHEGARTLLFRLPRWERLETGPALLAVLILLQPLLTIAVGRLYMGEGAVFHWRSALPRWASFVLIAWACYVLRPVPSRGADRAAAPGVAHLLSLLSAQSLALSALYMLVSAGLQRTDWLDRGGVWLQWTVWLLPLVWGLLAMLGVLMRTGERSAGRRATALCAVALSYALSIHFNPAPQYWTEAAGKSEDDDKFAQFSQENVEAQAPLLAQKVAALAPERAGIADMYTLTFAPYATEDVFRRESLMVSEVMAKRFDAAGRGLNLVNHADDVGKAPWATPTNLRRALLGLAAAMDVEEDVLFIHLTSHGAADGELAASFWPLDVAPVTPEDLRTWLDEAGIKHRVISISACYSGSWIAPLASDDTLVMTAADADHTSYGCGKKSALTFFGRAMFDEQLRSKTLSFEAAHAAARLVIDKREKEAGKDDGYSNPQITVGRKIRPILEKMRSRLTGR